LGEEKEKMNDNGKFPLLQIGMQYGVGAGDCQQLNRCHIALNRAFEKYDPEEFLEFYSGLAILGRVAGGGIDFEGGGGPRKAAHRS
jgi:hypothetical protein